MDSIIIATKNSGEADRIKNSIAINQNVAIITTEDEFAHFRDSANLLILDHSFAEKIEPMILANITKEITFPVIFLTDPNNGKIANDALHHCIRTCIEKSGDYYPLLKHTVRRAVDEYNEKQNMKQTIAALKKRVDELETRLKEADKKEETKESEEIQTDKRKAQLLEEIIFVFKRGKIEFSSPLQMAIKFRDLIKKGANIKNIADLLSKDIAVSSKLISISNSAYYRGVVTNKNLQQAISRLGIKTTRQYADAILNRTMYATKNKQFRGFIENLWEHSLSCASPPR